MSTSPRLNGSSAARSSAVSPAPCRFTITRTVTVGDGVHSAIIKATKPVNR